ncbi:MAG: anthrax toxin-like adenylyl cyclase domain-containing protein [Longimicrobiales bacterium]|nr:anthrax toxin-like adenylyl cyclase domain-containing protein [Longimicrobiales bacterium]
MPKITNSGVWIVPGPAGKILERAGFHPAHGLAIQFVADDFERIIVSRCAATVAIGLLDEGYSSKGFGIKAKSCDWGPFAGFAMSHVQYSKMISGADPKAVKKQQKFFAHGRSDTGFGATDDGGINAPPDGHIHQHSSMAAPDILKLSAPRLEYLRSQQVIDFLHVRDGGMVSCNSPFGPMNFRLVDLKTGSAARWGIQHQDSFHEQGGKIVQEKGGQWTLVRAMTNTAKSGSATDPHRQCCAGDYDLWGVFPKKGSSVASTHSLAAHGMDRQMQIFSSAKRSAKRKVSEGIGDRIRRLQQATRDQAVERTQHGYGTYKEDREKGNISALTLHTARELNRRIRKKGYLGGDMIHHNDDLGNPFRSDVEEELIAFVPGEMHPQFIVSTGTGGASQGSIGWNQWVRAYEGDYVIYDNPAIHRTRSQ